MANFELRTQDVHYVAVKVFSIIFYDGLGQAISTDDIILNKCVTCASLDLQMRQPLTIW